MKLTTFITMLASSADPNFKIFYIYNIYDLS